MMKLGLKDLCKPHSWCARPFLHSWDWIICKKTGIIGSRFCRLYRKHSDICFWGGLRMLPVLMECKVEAGISHGKTGAREGEVPDTLKRPDLTRMNSLLWGQHPGVGAKPFMRNPLPCTNHLLQDPTFNTGDDNPTWDFGRAHIQILSAGKWQVDAWTHYFLMCCHACFLQ